MLFAKFKFYTGWIEQETHFRSARHNFSKKWNREEFSAYPFARPITADLHVLPKKPWGLVVSNEEYPPLFVWVWRKPKRHFFSATIFFQKIQHNTPYSTTADSMAPPNAPPATTHQWERTSMPAHVDFAPVLRAANPLFTYIRLPLHPGIRGEFDICDFPRDVIELGPEILRRDLYTHNKDIQRSFFFFFHFLLYFVPKSIYAILLFLWANSRKNREKLK